MNSMNINRRESLMVAGATVAMAGISRASARTSTSRPNILWIMTDQQVADGMSCTGNPDLKTPAMDSIAAKGVRFDLAYCSNPICVPSRSSMMTGKMPHEIGVNFNMNRFDIQSPSLGTFITKAGYDTGYIGKWHIPMPTNTTDWHGFNLMLEGTRKFNDQHFAEPIIDFMRKKRDKPFFLVASFVNPHDICEWARKASGFPKEKSTTWNGPIAEAPPPEECPELPDNFQIPEHEPDIIREHQTWLKSAYPTREWPDERWRQYRWALNRLTERVDSEIAKILKVLRADGLDNNTVIIFTSDHGDGNGAHRWNQKTLLYEESARVPFIMSGKGVANPGSVDSKHLIATGIDIFPTVCDYAGVQLPKDLRGLSLRPLVEGQSVEWRDQLVVETDLHRRYGQSGGVYGRMLRTKNYKYVAYSAGKIREQLTDMHNDSGEMNNLALDPAYRDVLQEHRDRLAEQLAETDDFFVVPCIARDGWVLRGAD
jgi:arylsulfatase A-like enzyme